MALQPASMQSTKHKSKFIKFSGLQQASFFTT